MRRLVFQLVFLSFFTHLYTFLIRIRIPLYLLCWAVITILNEKREKKSMIDTFQIRKHLSSFQIIIIGFAGVIVLGALLLMLPISSKERVVTSFHDALFTATSAVCVTGLVVKDTGSYWSLFGQCIILLLIQIGGLGVVTIAAAFAILSGKKISLMQRSVMQEAISAPRVGGIVRLTRFVIRGTLCIEAIGAVCLSTVFCRQYGIKGIWYGIFHSVSAFCNAGFDILGTKTQMFHSLCDYVSSPMVNIVIMLLIVIGGIGFFTWEDIVVNKWHVHKYHMQSKVILVTTAFLIFAPALFFFMYEYTDLPMNARILGALFQSVTLRTAGFNTLDLAKYRGVSTGLMIFLMLIGGSPGSTAGGMKTTTFAVLVSNMKSTFSRKSDAGFFGRRITCEVIRQAETIAMMYIMLFFFGAMAISVKEGLPFSECLFETASAMGTVGLTLGITPYIGVFSQMILIMLMFMGRVGALTLIYATVKQSHGMVGKLPQENITVG